MSILGDTANVILFFFIGGFTLLLLVSGGLAAMLRVYRPSAVIGPERIGPQQQAWHVAVALLVGFVTWIGIQIVYIAVKQGMAMRGHSNPPPALQLGDADYAFLSTVPFIVGFTVLLGGNFVLGGKALLQRLGVALRLFPAGVVKGLIASAVIVPPVFLVIYLSDMVMRRFQIPHPQEHELLKAMGESHNLWIRAALIFGAVAGAPVFEEFLFRGHLQTLLRKAMISMGAIVKPPIPPMMQPLPVPPPLPDAPVAPYREPDVVMAVSVVQAPAAPPVWQTWTAIVLASALFAVVHPLWMSLPIFVLALGLGYSYERTGNLWTNVTVHCVFNSISTIYFLLSRT